MIERQLATVSHYAKHENARAENCEEEWTNAEARAARSRGLGMVAAVDEMVRFSLLFAHTRTKLGRSVHTNLGTW